MKIDLCPLCDHRITRALKYRHLALHLASHLVSDCEMRESFLGELEVFRNDVAVPANGTPSYIRPEQGFIVSCPCGKELGVVCDEKGAVRTLGYHLRQHLGQGETLAGHIALGVCR
jgi:hypothetical protein